MQNNTIKININVFRTVSEQSDWNLLHLKAILQPNDF